MVPTKNASKKTDELITTIRINKNSTVDVDLYLVDNKNYVAINEKLILKCPSTAGFYLENGTM